MASGAIKPRRKDCVASHSARLPSQQHEYLLCDVFGQMRIANQPARGGIHQTDVSLNDSREGGLRAVLDVVLQEFVIIHVNASIRLWPPRAEIRQDFQRCINGSRPFRPPATATKPF